MDRRHLDGRLPRGAARGRGARVAKPTLLTGRFAPEAGLWNAEPLHPDVALVADGSYWSKDPPAIRGTGYAIDALEAALWAFASTDDYRGCVLAAANLGDDADTTAAIAGQLAGAHYGVQESADGIPTEWRAKLALLEGLEGLADGLVGLALRG